MAAMTPTTCKVGDREIDPLKLRRIPQLQGESTLKHWQSALFFVLTFHGLKKYVVEGVEDNGRMCCGERMLAYALVREHIDPSLIGRLEKYCGLKFGEEEDYNPKKLYSAIVKCVDSRAAQAAAEEKQVEEWFVKQRLNNASGQ